MRRLSIQRRMRSILVEPVGIPTKLPTEWFAAKWHENDPRTFVLQTQDESLYERDTPVLANSTETGLDPIAVTPILEPDAPELLPLITDNVFWRRADIDDSAFEEGLNS